MPLQEEWNRLQKKENMSRYLQHQTKERVAIVVVGGPASGKTQATEMALHSLADSKDVMAFCTDQLRKLVSGTPQTPCQIPF